MTLPIERFNAILNARAFLLSLLTVQGIPKCVRIEARNVLKHYPTEYDMAHFKDLTGGHITQDQ